MDFVVLATDVASLSFKKQLPPTLVEHLIGKRPFITFATLGELSKCEIPLATLNVKDFADFAEYEGLVIVGQEF